MALLSKFLDKYLHNYIQQIDKANIETNYLTGYAKLKNFSLTSHFLTSFGIPLRLKENKVGEATFQFRFTDFSQKPASLVLRNVDLVATPDWDVLGKSEIETVEQLIQFITTKTESSKSQTKKEWNNYLEKIIDNAIIQIHDVRIHIEFNTKNSITDALTFSLKELTMNHVDSKGNFVFFKEKPQVLNKQIQLSQFAIGFHTKINCISAIDAFTTIVYNFLTPIDFTFTMIHDRRRHSEFLNIFELVFSQNQLVFLNFDQKQYFSIISLYHAFQKSQIKQRFSDCRRPEKALINYHMWHYLFRCALKIRRPHSFNPKLVLSFLKHRKSFCDNFHDDNLSNIAKNSIKQYGEKVTFLLIQYSLIIRNKNKQRKRKTDSIKGEDSPFYRKDSVKYFLSIPLFMLNIGSIGMINFSNIECSLVRIKENSRFFFNIKQCTIQDPSNKILEVQNEHCNFLICDIESRNNTASLVVSGFRINLYSSFLNKISVFFTDPQKPSIKKEKSLNSSLVMLNPRTMSKFKVIFYSCSFNYLIDNSIVENNRFLFSIGVDQIELKNFSKKLDPNLHITTSFKLHQIKIDDITLSHKFMLKSTTTTVSTGHIDKFDFLNDITTNITVSNSTIQINTISLDKINQVLHSILSNTVSTDSTDSYSNHHISLVCSNISFRVNTGKSNFQLEFSEIDITPNILLKNLSIYHESKENIQIFISSIDLNKLSLIDVNMIDINLNSIEFFILLDEFIWMLNQSSKILETLYNTQNKEVCVVNDKEEKAIIVQTTQQENIEPLTINATTVNYKMGINSNSIKINKSKVIIKNEITVELNLFEIFDSNDSKLLFIEDRIGLVIQNSQNDSIINIKFDNLTMNFIWNEIQKLIQYFRYPQVEKSNETNQSDSKNIVSVEIGHSLIIIEKSFSISLNNLTLKLISSLNSAMSLIIQNIHFDTVAELNGIVYNISGINHSLLINSINSYISPVNFDTIGNLSFVSTYFENSESNQKNLILSILINQISIHFPFEDDPSFKNHDFSLLFDVNYRIDQFQIHSLQVNTFKMFFSKSIESERIEYLPIISNKSFGLIFYQPNLSLETEESCFDIHLSVLDIIELQLIVNNFIVLLRPFLNPCNSNLQSTQKSLVKSMKIKPITINLSLCEENREYNKFNPIFVLSLNKNVNSVDFNNNQLSFNSSFVFSINYMNYFYGKLDTFMNETSCNFSLNQNNSTQFDLSFGDLNFTIHPLSFSSIMSSLNKFNHSEHFLFYQKKETAIKAKYDYWIRNCLDDTIHLTFWHNNIETKIELGINETQSLPFSKEDNDEIKCNATFKGLDLDFTLHEIQFPVYFLNISISTIPFQNNEKLIVFTSPLSIENKLDMIISVHIKENGLFQKYIDLYPSMRYPIPFEENQYYIESKFEYFTKDKREKSNQRNISTFNLPNKNENFVLSFQKAPKSIKITDVSNNNRPVSFVLNINNDFRTNARIYEILPSFSVLNYLPCPVSVQITEADQKQVNKQIVLIQHNHKKQVNFFNHTISSLQISLGFSFDCFGSETTVKLDEYDELYECSVGFAKNDNSYHFALRIQENPKEHQKEIIVFSPCIIFDETDQILKISPYSSINNIYDYSKVSEAHPHVPLFYAPQSYFENDKSMKISIKTDKSFPLLNAIDLMQIQKNCSTANIPMTKDNEYFYPINCSITLGQYPMNMTRIVTFTPFLYVVNQLPIDFELILIPSNNLEPFKISSKNNNKKENAVLIDKISASGLFQFCINSNCNQPLIQLNSITRTVFLVNNQNDQIYIELNIVEQNSAFCAYFKRSSFPVPLIINNSLNTPIIASQFNDHNSNRFYIESNSSQVFAFNEPFLKSDRIFIQLLSADKTTVFDEYWFSIEEQLSPLISEMHNILIETKIIDKNNSRMIQVRYIDDVPLYQKKFISKLSITTLSLSFQNEELKNIAGLTLKQLCFNLHQDQMNTIFTFSMQSIQIDDQNQQSKVPVCFLGTNEQLIGELANISDNFLEIDSIFPRGVPLLSVIYYLNVRINPIFITFDVSFIMTLFEYFTHFLYPKNSETLSTGMVLFEPSFNSISANKTLISFFQVNSINLLIDSPDQNTFSITTVITKLFKAIVSHVQFSSPELFVTEFDSNISILSNIFVNFYMNEIIKQTISNFPALKFISKYLTPYAQAIDFTPLRNIARKKWKKLNCANTKLLYTFFNSIELNNIQALTKKYFQKQSTIISELVNEGITSSNLLIHHPNDNNQTYEKSERVERFIVGKKDIVNNSSKLFMSINQLFKSKNIQRVAITSISPYYSSVTDVTILNQLQEKFVKNSSMKTVKFILNCQSEKNLVCLTTDSIYLLDDQIEIIHKFPIDSVVHTDNVGNLVYISVAYSKEGIFTMIVDAGNSAPNVLLFINTQKMIIQLFGSTLI